MAFTEDMRVRLSVEQIKAAIQHPDTDVYQEAVGACLAHRKRRPLDAWRITNGWACPSTVPPKKRNRRDLVPHCCKLLARAVQKHSSREKTPFRLERFN